MWPKLRFGAGAVCLLLLSCTANPKTVQVKVEQLEYIPNPVSAHVGDTIEWINKDFIPHTATEKNGAWEVTFEPGEKKSIVVTKPGTIDYYCRLHPNMVGKIIVTGK